MGTAVRCACVQHSTLPIQSVQTQQSKLRSVCSIAGSRDSLNTKMVTITVSRTVDRTLPFCRAARDRAPGS